MFWVLSAAKTVPALSQVNNIKLVALANKWMFRCIDGKQLSAALTKLAGENVKSLHLVRVLKDNPSFFDYKVWLSFVLQNKFSSAQARSLLRKWKLPVSFMAGLRVPSLVLSQIRCKLKGYECHALPEARKHLSDRLGSVSSWLGKFVWKKLRFIEEVQRVGKTRADLEQDLVLESLRGYSLAYPLFQSALHAVNTIKRIMHNCGINLIKHYTRLKVSGTIREADSNSARLVELDKVSIGESYCNDAFLDVCRIRNKYKGRKRLVVDMLCGKFHTKFSEWLVSIGKRSNDELFERVSLQTYLRLVSKWLRVKYSAVCKFVERIRMQLAEYQPGA